MSNSNDTIPMGKAIAIIVSIIVIVGGAIGGGIYFTLSSGNKPNTTANVRDNESVNDSKSPSIQESTNIIEEHKEQNNADSLVNADPDSESVQVSPVNAQASVPMDWIIVSDRISIPPDWTYDHWNNLEIFGKGIGGEPFGMVVSSLSTEDYSFYMENNLWQQDFSFNDGYMGVMLTTPDEMIWINGSIYASIWIGDGLQTVFSDNEEIITAVARTLTEYPGQQTLANPPGIVADVLTGSGWISYCANNMPLGYEFFLPEGWTLHCNLLTNFDNHNHLIRNPEYDLLMGGDLVIQIPHTWAEFTVQDYVNESINDSNFRVASWEGNGGTTVYQRVLLSDNRGTDYIIHLGDKVLHIYNFLTSKPMPNQSLISQSLEMINTITFTSP